MSVIHLVRHGQASFGADDYDLLSALGERQSRVLGQALAGIGPRIVHAASGEMRRQRQTADACLQAMGSDVPARVDPDWNEFDHMAVIVALHPQFADRARMRAELMAQPDPHAAVQAVFEEAMARWVAGRHEADYPESWQAFRTRCRQALARVVEALPPGHDAIVFTSGGPIAAIAQDLLQIPEGIGHRLSFGLVNCGVTKLVNGRDGLRLSTLNGHAHFEDDQAGLVTYR